MTKGQVVAGDFSKVIMRIKNGEDVEVGDFVYRDPNTTQVIAAIMLLNCDSK